MRATQSEERSAEIADPTNPVAAILKGREVSALDDDAALLSFYSTRSRASILTEDPAYSQKPEIVNRTAEASADVRSGELVFLEAIPKERLLGEKGIRSCFAVTPPCLVDFDVAWFCSLCLAARSLEDVNEILHMLYDGLGANACLLAQFGANRRRPTFQFVIDGPPGLAAEITSRRLTDDAIMVACQQRVFGFLWSDLERIIEMTDKRRETLAIYAAHGLHEGFTIPLSVPGEPRGFCSFGWSNPHDLTLDIMSILLIAAPALFETVRRLRGMWIVNREKLELTPRQIDCLVGVSRGLNDMQIAHELGISVQTVHDHLEEARKRYGAHKRTDLLVKAIRSGELPWSRITRSQ